MTDDLTVVTFMLAKAVFWDRDLDAATICGAVNAIAINPQTGTNDRHEVVVEFDRSVDRPLAFEYRIERLGPDPRTVLRERWHYDPRYTDTMRWVFFTLRSLPPDAWHIGRPHAMEFWTLDRRLAHRQLACVPIEDSPAPGPKDE